MGQVWKVCLWQNPFQHSRREESWWQSRTNASSFDLRWIAQQLFATVFCDFNIFQLFQSCFDWLILRNWWDLANMLNIQHGSSKGLPGLNICGDHGQSRSYMCTERQDDEGDGSSSFWWFFDGFSMFPRKTSDSIWGCRHRRQLRFSQWCSCWLHFWENASHRCTGKRRTPPGCWLCRVGPQEHGLGDIIMFPRFSRGLEPCIKILPKAACNLGGKLS